MIVICDRFDLMSLNAAADVELTAEVPTPE